MLVNRVEFTTDNVCHIHQYNLDEKTNSATKSYNIVSYPVPAWSNQYDISYTMIKLCLDTNRWPLHK